ncbi:MAG: hypothetical protein HZA31_11045 [Opitutae bacterium]|nr:hypothetical protein [Opitutae bacterium]
MPFALRLLFWISLLGAVACGGAHLASFAGYTPLSLVALLGLVLLLFIVWPLVIWRWRRVPRRNLVSEIFGNIPRWLKFTAVALLVYAFANYFGCRALNAWGDPVKLDDGRLALQAKAKIVRVLTPAEFRAAQIVQVRMLTGELAVFFALAAVMAHAVWIKTGPAMANAKV